MKKKKIDCFKGKPGSLRKKKKNEQELGGLSVSVFSYLKGTSQGGVMSKVWPLGS